MRIISLVFLMSIGLLVGACGSAAPQPTAGVAEATSPPTPNSVAPQSPLPQPDVVGQQNSPVGRGVEEGMVQWDQSGEVVVASATFCCGFTTQSYALNYLAAATIWGDGRIVWVMSEADGSRQVLEDRLNPEQISQFLSRAVTAGFFEWESRYADQAVADAADKCIQLNLRDQLHQVCEYVRGAPQAFHTLYAELSSGLGLTGVDYNPQAGYLTAFPVEPAAGEPPAETMTWPASQAGFPLSASSGGRWVEGEALQSAWRIVNSAGPGTLVQDGQAHYELTLQLPDLSVMAPPAR